MRFRRICFQADTLSSAISPAFISAFQPPISLSEQQQPELSLRRFAL